MSYPLSQDLKLQTYWVQVLSTFTPSSKCSKTAGRMASVALLTHLVLAPALLHSPWSCIRNTKLTGHKNSFNLYFTLFFLPFPPTHNRFVYTLIEARRRPQDHGRRMEWRLCCGAVKKWGQ